VNELHPQATAPLPRTLHEVCDRFEATWQAALAGGPRPRLEDFLDGIADAHQPALLRELLSLEVFYLRQLGETPALPDYQQRLPVFPAAWLAHALTAYDGSDTEHPSAPIRREEPPGAWTIPGYEILGELGRGGMGVVYRARHQGLQRLVALKMILAGVNAGLEDLTRFRTEAEAIARLQHPHIVQIFEIGEYDHLPFLALEYCAGGSLDKKLAGTPYRRGKPPRSWRNWRKRWQLPMPRTLCTAI
jgi:hypothetical protein